MIVFSSAGSPKKYTSYLQKKGIIVVHVIANTKFALKSVEAGHSQKAVGKDREPRTKDREPRTKDQEPRTSHQ